MQTTSIASLLFGFGLAILSLHVLGFRFLYRGMVLMLFYLVGAAAVRVSCALAHINTQR